MKQRTWVIIGATSQIAQEFAKLAAAQGYSLLLIGRHADRLKLISQDIILRYQVSCDAHAFDFTTDSDQLLQLLDKQDEYDLMLAHSVMYNNDTLDQQSIAELVEVNITFTLKLIHAYWHKPQTQHHLLFISSVAAVRGRVKNSLYGASKATIEVYLQGLQQAASATQTICIARLGFIDTHVTYGQPGIFYAASPKQCAAACWQAAHSKKPLFYYPHFWRYIMAIFKRVPLFIYKKMQY